MQEVDTSRILKKVGNNKKSRKLENVGNQNKKKLEKYKIIKKYEI